MRMIYFKPMVRLLKFMVTLISRACHYFDVLKNVFQMTKFGPPHCKNIIIWSFPQSPIISVIPPPVYTYPLFWVVVFYKWHPLGEPCFAVVQTNGCVRLLVQKNCLPFHHQASHQPSEVLILLHHESHHLCEFLSVGKYDPDVRLTGGDEMHRFEIPNDS